MPFLSPHLLTFPSREAGVDADAANSRQQNIYFSPEPRTITVQLRFTLQPPQLRLPSAMAIASAMGSGLVALLHAYFLVLEMFLWTTPRGRKTFKMTADYAETTKVLAGNMGLYNGFLTAGLVWGLLHSDDDFAAEIRLFFLGCVVVAGIYGGLTASTRIFYVQALPATLSILAVLLAI